MQRGLFLSSFIPQGAWVRRLAYELVYAWPGSRHVKTFNIGLAPVDAAILSDPALAEDAHQIQLYSELFSLAGLDAEGWRRSTVIEVAAGCGGGLLYLSRRHRPRTAIGVDVSAVASWRGRRLGIDLRQGEATRLPFEERSFDCLVCVDALNYFAETEFMSEAMRVLKPTGRLLVAESSPTLAEAEGRFRRLARLGGLTIETMRDVSEGARRSLRERSTKVARAVAWVPPLLRRRVGEMLGVEGSERYRRWQAGEYCFAMAMLRRSAVSG